MSTVRDRRGNRPGSPGAKPEVPWLKDRPDLHRAEDDEAGVPPKATPPERPPPPAEGGDQRVPGGDRRAPQQPSAGHGDATKARRPPS